MFETVPSALALKSRLRQWFSNFRYRKNLGIENFKIDGLFFRCLAGNWDNQAFV